MEVTRSEPDTTDDLDDAGGSGPVDRAPARRHWGWDIAGLLTVVALAALTQWLVTSVPRWTRGTGFGKIAESLEFPIYAIVIGFGANAVLSLIGVRERMQGGFRTEFFIKTGVVLLGASVNFGVIVKSAGPSVVQAFLMIGAVFFFTWWLAGRLGLDQKMRALLASAVSICGVSAAIAAAGAVRAKKEQLAYVASLVILFALPSIFLLPWLAHAMGLSPEVSGAWIGGNIDTTAAVAAAGALAGETSLQIATIVKTTQNALMGVVAVLLTIYFAARVERTGEQTRLPLGELWHRFPKFVLGFLAASIAATIFAHTADAAVAKAAISAANALRSWFLIAAFISIGLEFKVGSLRQAGWRPVAVFAGAALFNLVFGLGLATLLFGGVHV